MTNINKKTVDEQIHELKARVKAIKPFLPKDWRQRLKKRLPNLNYSGNLLGNIIMLKTYDSAITHAMEGIAFEYFTDLATGLKKAGIVESYTIKGLKKI